MVYSMSDEDEVLSISSVHFAKRNFLDDTYKEHTRAMAKFPNPTCSLAALMEEVGELAQAYLKLAAGKGAREQVWLEAVQVATMAMRVAIEGDPSIEAALYKEP